MKPRLLDARLTCEYNDVGNSFCNVYRPDVAATLTAICSFGRSGGSGQYYFEHFVLGPRNFGPLPEASFENLGMGFEDLGLGFKNLGLEGARVRGFGLKMINLKPNPKTLEIHVKIY